MSTVQDQNYFKVLYTASDFTTCDLGYISERDLMALNNVTGASRFTVSKINPADEFLAMHVRKPDGSFSFFSAKPIDATQKGQYELRFPAEVIAEIASRSDDIRPTEVLGVAGLGRQVADKNQFRKQLSLRVALRAALRAA